MSQAVVLIHLPRACHPLPIGIEQGTELIEAGCCPIVVKAVPQPLLHQAAFISRATQVTLLGVEEVVEGAQHEILNQLGAVHALAAALGTSVQHAIFGDNQRLVLLPPIFHPLAKRPDLLIEDLHVYVSTVVVVHHPFLRVAW